MSAAVIDRVTFDEFVETIGSDYFDEVLGVFLGDTPNQIATMDGALAAADAESLQRAAHSLKSNAGSFGARRLATLARELETMARARALAGAAETLAALTAEYADVARTLRELRRG